MTLPKPERDWDRIATNVSLTIIAVAALLWFLSGCSPSVFSWKPNITPPPPMPDGTAVETSPLYLAIYAVAMVIVTQVTRTISHWRKDAKKKKALLTSVSRE